MRWAWWHNCSFATTWLISWANHMSCKFQLKIIWNIIWKRRVSRLMLLQPPAVHYKHYSSSMEACSCARHLARKRLLGTSTYNYRTLTMILTLMSSNELTWEWLDLGSSWLAPHKTWYCEIQADKLTGTEYTRNTAVRYFATNNKCILQN